MRIGLLASLLTLAGGLNTPRGAFSLAVSPTSLQLTVQPGRTVKGTILVTGETDRPLRITSSVGDWNLDPKGSLLFLAAGRLQRSLAAWLKLSPAQFTLSRGRPQVIRYQLSVPAGVAGSYWGVLFFQTEPLGGIPAGATGIRTAARLTTMMYMHTERGGTISGKIDGLGAKYRPNGQLDLRADLRNLGTLIFKPGGWFELQEQQSGKIAAKAAVEPVTVLPGGNREIIGAWRGKLAPGKYVPVLHLRQGGWKIASTGAALVVP